MKCDELDYFSDMYPEFAPEPIVVSCDEVAHARVEIISPMLNDEGYEVKGGYERHQRFLCSNHLAMFHKAIEDPYYSYPSEAKVIRVTEGLV